MKTFKEFLLTESVEYTLYKPQTGGRHALGWGSREDWADVYSFPANSMEIRKAMQESDSIRLILDSNGKLHMWSGGILHDIFINQVKEIKPYINLLYHNKDKYIYGDSSDSSGLDIEKLQYEVKKNPELFKKAFSQLQNAFPYLKSVIVGNDNEAMSLTEPFLIKNIG